MTDDLAFPAWAMLVRLAEHVARLPSPARMSAAFEPCGSALVIRIEPVEPTDLRTPTTQSEQFELCAALGARLLERANQLRGAREVAVPSATMRPDSVIMRFLVDGRDRPLEVGDDVVPADPAQRDAWRRRGEVPPVRSLVTHVRNPPGVAGGFELRPMGTVIRAVHEVTQNSARAMLVDVVVPPCNATEFLRRRRAQPPTTALPGPGES